MSLLLMDNSWTIKLSWYCLRVPLCRESFLTRSGSFSNTVFFTIFEPTIVSRFSYSSTLMHTEYSYSVTLHPSIYSPLFSHPLSNWRVYSHRHTEFKDTVVVSRYSLGTETLVHLYLTWVTNRLNPTHTSEVNKYANLILLLWKDC